MNDQLRPLWLKPSEEKRLRAGHLWVFSNEVDNGKSPLKAFAPGDGAEIRDSQGRTIGCGYVNPHSLICARLVSRDATHPLSESLLVHRLKVALALRERLFPTPHYRLVYGESDGLPGLVIDRFGDTCVAQINTAGMERVRDAIAEALRKVVQAKHVLVRADSSMRELEGLERYVEWLGEPGPELLEIEENGVRFAAPALGGQKTGWFYDHRANRARLAPYVRGQRVLDVFSYAGAWAVQAACNGAAEVHLIDSSEQAIAQARENAARNGVADKVRAHHGDAFKLLRELREAGERFDTVILDPPAFIKRRKDYRQGLQGYQQINQAAMQLLARDGMLISASCSSHLTDEDFQRSLLRAARHLDRTAQLVELGQQGPDHPVHPAIPETRYLKCAFLRVLPASSNP